MSPEFKTYATIAILTWVVAAMLVRWRNFKEPWRFPAWYLFVILLSYVVRPAGSQWIGDNLLYMVLKIPSFEDAWVPMTIAVVLAFLFFGIGYRLATPRAPVEPEPEIDPLVRRRLRTQAIALAVVLIMWGYLSQVLSAHVGGEVVSRSGTKFGEYEGTTGWLVQSDLFVSSGATIIYAATGNLPGCLTMAAPWIIYRISFGYARTHLVGFFFGLLALYLFKRQQETRRLSFQGFVLVAIIAFTVIIVFPLLGLVRSSFQGASLDSLQKLVGVSTVVNAELMISIWLGTGSSLAGFEPTLGFLTSSVSPAWGTYYVYYYLIQPLPRVLFPWKGYPPTLANVLFDRPFDADFFGNAPGAIGMAFEQWGWIGIPMEFLFTGWFLRRCENWLERKPEAVYRQLAYSGLFSLIPQLGRDSLIFMIAMRWLFVYGATVSVLWWMERSVRARAQARTANLPGPLPAQRSGFSEARA
jgi:hypothetical protein